MKKDMIFKVSKVVVICSLFIIAFIAFVFENPKPIILGYIFGAAISILSFLLLNDSAKKLITMDPSRAKKRAYINYLIRFFIYFAVLFISAVADYLNILATGLGLTMVRNSIVILTALDKGFLK